MNTIHNENYRDMARTRKKNKQSKTSKKQMAGGSRRAVRPMGAMRTLDRYAQDYLRLLCDPCGAPLVHPVYSGGDSGCLVRTDNFVTYGNTAGITAGAVHWTPGYPNSSGSDLLVGTGATAASAVTYGVTSDAAGKLFLNVNTRAARCIAACMKVSFTGAESARSGRVHYGHTSAGFLDAGSIVQPNYVAQALQHYSRTPTDVIEIFWKPSEGDFNFCDPVAVSSPQIRDMKNAITVAFADLPAGIGLTFHMTAVFEWQPSYGQGVSNDVTTKVQSQNSFGDVLKAATEMGFTFVHNTAAAATQFVGAGVLSGISSYFGQQNQRVVTRSSQSIAY